MRTRSRNKIEVHKRYKQNTKRKLKEVLEKDNLKKDIKNIEIVEQSYKDENIDPTVQNPPNLSF